MTFSSLTSAIEEWGFVPVLWVRHGGLTLVSSFFLHAGIVHLVSNMYFFVVFADNVESDLGRPRLLVLLAGAHLAGLLVHGLVELRGAMPVVGASAGVSAVLAYYAVMFPRARLGYLVPWRAFYRVSSWIQMPAWMSLAAFAMLQLIGALGQVSGFGRMAYAAHVGGLAVGIGVAAWVRLHRNRRRFRWRRD
jgi:membrane associated rhomboid family serine protease